MSDYHLVTNINQSCLFYLFVTCQSILDSLEDTADNEQDHLIFHVLLDPDVNLLQANTYVQLFTEFNADSKVSFNVELHQANVDTFSSCPVMYRNGVASFTSYLRILFARFIPEEVQRVLYLDMDILVCADVRDIFKQYPCNNKVMHVCSNIDCIYCSEDPLDKEPKIRFTSKKSDIPDLLVLARNYIQAGVMLINVTQWRLQDIERKCLDVAPKWQFPYFDQDILTIVCQENVSYLDWDWNMHFSQLYVGVLGKYKVKNLFIDFENIFCNNLPSFTQLQSMCQSPKIVHFAGDFKPWNYHRLDKELCKVPHRLLGSYCMQWLQIYARLATFFKSKRHSFK